MTTASSARTRRSTSSRELARFCRDELGSAPVEAVFYEASVGSVSGLLLDDGRCVVVKGHWLRPADELAACAEVQTELADRGYPCPRPLLGPRPLGRGYGTVEELVDDGDRRDAHEPPIRRDSLRVVYDWDSLGLAPEPELVGYAACHFTTTWYLDVPLIPTPDEARAFVADYEGARGRAFTPDERGVVGAAAAYGLAYGARCESCADPEATSFAAGSQREALAAHGEEMLSL